ERVLMDLAHQFADGAVWIVCAAAPEEECGVLLPKCIEPSVGANGLSHCLRCNLPPMDRRQKVLKHIWRIGHPGDVREVDPGESAEKVERRVSGRLGQDHRYDREARIAGLPHKGELSFVLLGVAEPTLPNQYDHGLGGPDGLLQRPNPGQPRKQIAM